MNWNVQKNLKIEILIVILTYVKVNLIYDGQLTGIEWQRKRKKKRKERERERERERREKREEKR